MYVLPKWRANPTPENATYDSKGYAYPKNTSSDNSWASTILGSLSGCNEKAMKKQRELGFKYYESDPGRDPFEMGKYEQDKVTGAFLENVCTIL